MKNKAGITINGLFMRQT